MHFYEKLTFEGHEALKLLVKNKSGDLAIASILKSMWPSGDVDDADGQAKPSLFEKTDGALGAVVRGRESYD